MSPRHDQTNDQQWSRDYPNDNTNSFRTPEDNIIRTSAALCGNHSFTGSHPDTFGKSNGDYEGGRNDNKQLGATIGSKIESNSNANIYQQHQSPGPITATHCPQNYDGILCWNTTAVGETTIQPCMEHFIGVQYNGTATRACDLEGVWSKTDFSSCEHINRTLGEGIEEPIEYLETVYYCGYGLSLFALVCAILIFVLFKELRCLRNTIHTHLIITYILHDALWVISSGVATIHSKTEKSILCIFFILLHYFYLTKFFWMFVEGLYLYVLVVQTFMAENIKLKTYCIIGWGIPLAVVKLWIIVRWITYNAKEAKLSHIMGTLTSEEWLLMPSSSTIAMVREFDQNPLFCPWLHESFYDWIHKSSALLCLGANMAFLLQIMWVLITKLRSATTPETQQSRKAAKALVVLMPLLGITYVLVLIGPKRLPLYEYLRAALISTQGFLVALFYCFLNHEVRVSLRHRWNKVQICNVDWTCFGYIRDQEQRNNLQQGREWSPRSRTESIRLYTPTSRTFRKRESSASETTTMTAVLGNFNGSGTGQSMVLTTIPNRRHSSITQMHLIRSSGQSSSSNINEDTPFV